MQNTSIIHMCAVYYTIVKLFRGDLIVSLFHIKLPHWLSTFLSFLDKLYIIYNMVSRIWNSSTVL